ncbi:hypothetical protein Pelo_9089 [Pelomyxa schiedti]|nr:hypothetical protein Pelo_9089 [Pelomyxa schiedti]
MLHVKKPIVFWGLFLGGAMLAYVLSRTAWWQRRTQRNRVDIMEALNKPRQTTASTDEPPLPPREEVEEIRSRQQEQFATKSIEAAEESAAREREKKLAKLEASLRDTAPAWHNTPWDSTDGQSGNNNGSQSTHPSSQDTHNNESCGTTGHLSGFSDTGRYRPARIKRTGT